MSKVEERGEKERKKEMKKSINLNLLTLTPQSKIQAEIQKPTCGHQGDSLLKTSNCPTLIQDGLNL